MRETLDEVISPIVFAEALELFDQHHAAGRHVVIVSSAPFEVVGPLGEFLGADEVIATRAEIDDDGNYTGELAFYAYGPYKAEEIREIAAREDIDLSASYAYSDSVTDLPMLESVGHPVAVNPDKELAREARERGWEVRVFQRPVRLRDRVPVPPKGPTIAVGSVLATAGAGAAAYVWWRRAPVARSCTGATVRPAPSSRPSRPGSSPMDRLAAAIGSPARLLVKRDDLTGLALGGNKARKLEHLCGEALDRGCDTLVTGGGPQSNHARMTAAAANRLGLDCHLALAGRAPRRHDGNLLLDDLLGATLHFTGARDYYEIETSIEELAAPARRPTGARPFAIPVGGASVTGVRRVRARDRRAAHADRRIPTGSSSPTARVARTPACSPDSAPRAATRVVGVDVGTRPDLDDDRAAARGRRGTRSRPRPTTRRRT